jgi:outer membrane protein assembly factor BamB
LYGSPSTYRLFAVDQGTGKVVWSSKVWGSSKVWPRGVIANSGPDWHFVSMRPSGGTLVVFGLSGTGIYVEAFDRKTGENRCRFSTAYFDFDAIAPRK